MRRLPFIALGTMLSLFPMTGRAADVPVWWETVLSDSRFPADRMQKNMQAACELITRKSLTPVSAGELAFESVKALSTIDGKIRIVRDGKRVLILGADKILKSFSAPDDSDCAGWSRLILAATVEARPYSPKARAADAEEFYNIFLNAALAKVDSYSHYAGADPAELKPLKNPAGVGIAYRRVGKYLEITSILPDGAAAQSDLAVGDRIAAIDSRPVSELSRVEALNLLRGEAGSTAFLTLRKDGKTQTRALTRKPVSSTPVTYFFDDENALMTIKIAAFSERAAAGLTFALNKARKLGAKGLIIDLRGNTGGLLRQAVLCADMFLPEGLRVIKTKGRAPETEQSYTSTAKDDRPVYPIALLVDAKTASSAEFFAGVLQEYRHGVVIGTPTYGKGVIQANDALPDGGRIHLTWANYYLPSGYTPQGYGIYPNVCTSNAALSTIDDLPRPQTRLKPWRTGDDAVKRRALQVCPPRPRADNPVEDEAAKLLLTNPDAYERALTYFSLDSMEK